MTDDAPDQAPPPQHTDLGDLELAVMGVLWSTDRATVREVHAALEPEHTLAYTTVMTVMTRLWGRGLLVREREGRAFVYQACSSRGEVTRSFVRRIIDRLLGGSRSALVSTLLADEALSPDELAEIRAAIDAYDDDQEPEGP